MQREAVSWLQTSPKFSCAHLHFMVPALQKNCGQQVSVLGGGAIGNWEIGVVGNGYLLIVVLMVVLMVPRWSAGFSSVLGCNLGLCPHCLSNVSLEIR